MPEQLRPADKEIPVVTVTDDVLTQLEAPTRIEDLPAEVQRRAEMLVAAVDGDRERLFELRSLYLLRLHRASDDFGATEALRVVERVLATGTLEGASSAR
jgi:hypothetical protein